MKKSFADISKYRTFIEDRDKALDQILFKYRVISSAILNRVKKETIQRILGLYSSGQLTYHTADNERLIITLRNLFINAASYTAAVYKKSLRRAYVLSVVGEVEAIGRVKMANSQYSLKQDGLDPKAIYRIKMYYDRLLRSVIDKTQRATFYAKDVSEFKEYLESAFPKKQTYKRLPRNLKPLKEADDSSMFHKEQFAKSADMATGFVSQEDWDGLLQDYQKEHIDPVTIFGRTGNDIYDMEGDEIFDWELDKDLIHEFITQVRSGQIEAANQNGVTDFVWIAVIDSKTCDNCCDGSGCKDRDGLTTTEIKEKFGEPTNAPAHFNCRCRMAPYDESIDKQSTEQLPDYGDFDEWINS